VLRQRSAKRIDHALALAKVCTKLRRETMGYDHRTVEAVRALLWAATRISDVARGEALGEAFGKIEEELLYRDEVAGRYDTVGAGRAEIIASLRESLAA